MGMILQGPIQFEYQLDFSGKSRHYWLVAWHSSSLNIVASSLAITCTSLNLDN
jgi:hypothetical protein